MAKVSVRSLNDTTFEVTVQDRSTTTHTVTVTPDYAARLTGGKITVEQLLSRSFDFLLEREANSSILSRFDLTVISRYFPEYERVIIETLT